MIDQYGAFDDFDKQVEQTRKKREETRKAVVKAGVDILNGDAKYDLAYFYTVLDFMTAENEHIRTVLDLVKCCYENFKTLKYSVAITLNDMQEFDALIEKTKVAFNEFYDVCEKLKNNENNLRNLIIKNADEMSKSNLAIIENLLDLRAYNSIHDAYHKELTDQINNVINPLIEKCESIYQEKDKSKANYGYDDNNEDPDDSSGFNLLS